MTKWWDKILFAAIIAAFLAAAAGQAQVPQPTTPREIIDTLRWGFDYKSAEAIKRANRAKQLDSTYYVTHLIEGFHYYDRAEEFTGLKRAVQPLRKALAAFKRDYGYCISRRYTRSDIYAGAWREILRQIDYYTLASTLSEVFISLEMPDSAYAALTRMRDDNLVFDFRSYQGLAWIYFRSRIYTSEKYPFLKDSIEENMKTAFLYTDSLEQKYKRAVPYMRREILAAYQGMGGFYNYFNNAFVKRPPDFVANTRGILYGYNFQPALSARYFMQMDGDENMAKNVNLGYTYHADINFRTSEEYFGKVKDNGSKSRGGHWQGYSTIFVYKGQPLEGAAKLREERDKNGFTIGYGWDNLCLARMYLYAGMTDEAGRALDKAENFSEVHFNTSFREDQYRFMLKALRLMKAKFEDNAYKFEDRNYWFSWDWLTAVPKLTWDRYSFAYDLANELALNPERDIVYYHLFHTESIISFDELWTIIQKFSNGFFQTRLAELQKTDPRENLDRYYRYFLGKLLIEEGESERAFDMLTTILSDPKLNQEYEKLLIARVHENCAKIAIDEGWEPQAEFHLNELYRFYPQLIPFSNIEMRFKVKRAEDLNEDDPQFNNILDNLSAYNIDWEPNDRENYPEVQFFNGEEGRLGFQVVMNRETVAQGMVDPNDALAARKLAYRLFRVRK